MIMFVNLSGESRPRVAYPGKAAVAIYNADYCANVLYCVMKPHIPRAVLPEETRVMN